MTPLKLSYRERSSLRTLVRSDGTCYRDQINKKHAERFLRDGLITGSPQRYHLTTRGQVEVLRQRYRGLRLRSLTRALKNEDANLLLRTFNV